MHCYYCDQISAADSAYAPRDAAFDQGSEAPRCRWHWRYRCDHCGRLDHFMSRFYCPRSGRLLCRESGEVHVGEGDFWAWQYWWEIVCPECGQRHPSLDRAESLGIHPWQIHPAAEATGRWLSDEPYLVRYPVRRLARAPEASVTDADVDAGWSANADVWDAGYDEHGDTNRRYGSDPVLLAFLGEVKGERVLDAGSGAGYLSRLLAGLGARVVGVENATRFHELALEYQQRELRDVEFHHASISSMPFLDRAGFDAAVANYVLMDVPNHTAAIGEIARVLRPGGRFVCAISHQSLDFCWHKPAPDSPRPEDRAGSRDDDYFVRRAGLIQWGKLKPFLSFHRPLRDYVAACKQHGLELRDLEEPELSEEAERTWPAYRLRQERRVPVSYVLRFVKR